MSELNKPAAESLGESEAPGQENTVFRNDMTVMRDDVSVTNTASTDSSWSGWRSGALVPGDPGEAEAPKVLKQRFVLEERIGSGGMGSVFRAKDLRKVEARGNQPFVAIKVLNNDFRHHPEAFIALEREATKSQGLRHPNIVSIFDFDKDGDVPFMTMELLEGDELAELLRTYPTGLPDELAWQVIEGMVNGLRHAHEEEVVHADFKPGNVYVTDRETTKILDFGIARAMRLNQAGEDTDFDPARLAALTPAYASREMLNGDNPEPRDDVFSLGIVIYMVLTGHHPYGRVPANDAAREGLRPERIKQLSRRRWRAIEQCLELNRQDRPADAAQVYEALFGKPVWHSWGLASAAAVIALTVGLLGLKDTAEMQEVKQEVRLETLVEAQLQRIHSLLETPGFDANWERQLFNEVQTLRTVAPGDVSNQTVVSSIETRYAQHIAQLENFDDAFARFSAGRKFGELSDVEYALHERLIEAADALEAQEIDSAWLQSAEQLLSYAGLYFPRSSTLTAARADLVGHVLNQLPMLVDAGDVDVADQFWNTFGGEVFDEQRWAVVDQGLQIALTGAAQQRAVVQAKRTLESLQQDLSQVLDVSCLRLDMQQVGSELTRLGRRYPSHIMSLRQQAGERVEACVERLNLLDADRAFALQKQAVKVLGSQAVGEHSADPCAMHYLVGNGKQQGRGGFCADQLSDDAQGPRLVVVPGDEQLPKFAISKYEITWRDFNEFCSASESCVPSAEDNLPVTGVSVQVVEAYAAWLSAKTGYRYRLPTDVEWRQAAQGEPDPNRNCRVEVGGVHRGDSLLAAQAGAANDLGLVHVLGNAQEWVKSVGAEYVAVGGTFSDPIELCLAETHRTIPVQGDANTGFRLVREVS